MSAQFLYALDYERLFVAAHLVGLREQEGGQLFGHGVLGGLLYQPDYRAVDHRKQERAERRSARRGVALGAFEQFVGVLRLARS